MQDSNQPSAFDELAKTLNKDERDQMLSQVHKDFLIDNNSSVVPHDMLHLSGLSQSTSKKTSDFTPMEQEMLRNELRKIGVFLRFILILKSVFTQRSLAQTYSEHKLKMLRQVVSARGSFINFENKSISSRFVSEISRIHSLIAPVRTVHLHVWQNSEVLNALITEMLGKGKIASVKTKPTDFVDFNQLLHLFTQSSDEDFVKHSIAKAQRDYFNSIPSSVFREISEKLFPFYVLCSLLTYPFRDLLILLGASDTENADPESGPAKQVPIMPVLNSLEEFYSILLSITFLNFEKSMTETFLKEALFSQFGEKNEDALNLAVHKNLVKLDELLSYIRNFLTRVPLPEIFCYFRGNPFYKVQPNSVKLNVKNFYIKSSRILISTMMSDTLQEIRLAYVSKSMEKLFHDKPLVPLKNYIEINDKVWDSLHLHSFAYAKGMLVTSNFLNFDYAEKITVFRNVLGNSVFAKIPGLQTKFGEYCANLEFLRSQIQDFDESLSPSSEQGKTFIHIQTNLTDNFQQARLVQAFVDHKDFEAHALLMNIVETLYGFVKFLNEKILGNSIESVQTQLAGVYHQLDRNRSLRVILEEWSNGLHSFAFMLRELIEHERTARETNIN